MKNNKFLTLSVVFLVSLVPFLRAFAGDFVCSRNEKNTALVIIDMQDLFRTRGGDADDPDNLAKAATLVKNQQDAIQNAMSANAPIIYIVYKGYGPTIPQLSSLTASYGKTVTFTKNTDGAFDSDNKYRGDLVKYMKDNQIGSLVIIGANGGACVHETIVGALNGNCSVHAVAAGIADFNYASFITPYMPEHYRDIVASKRCPNCDFSTEVEIQEVDLSFQKANGLLAGGGGKP